MKFSGGICRELLEFLVVCHMSGSELQILEDFSAWAMTRSGTISGAPPSFSFSYSILLLGRIEILIIIN